MNKSRVEVKSADFGTLTELADAELDLVTGGQAKPPGHT